MNEADLELILAQYSYRSGHAMTSTEILAAKQKAIAEIMALHQQSKTCGINCPKCYTKSCGFKFPQAGTIEVKNEPE